jgi:hypothetical protein
MPPDLLTPVLQRLDNEPRVFLAAEFARGLAPWRDLLLGLGVLREIAPSEFAVCWECGGGHAQRVRWLTNRRTGLPEPFVPCNECGSVRIPADSLRRFDIDIPKLLTDVLAAAGGHRTPTEVVPDHLWHLGNIKWCGRAREAFFSRYVHDRNRSLISAPLATRLKAVLFSPTVASANAWSITSNPVIPLESVLSLGPGGITFDSELVESRLVDAGWVETSKRKSPRKRGARVAKIELLTKALTEHLRAARSQAIDTRDLKRDPILLPRPSQKRLAELTGMTAPDVSRCLNDPSATLLRVYWQWAASLDRIMGWEDPFANTSS